MNEAEKIIESAGTVDVIDMSKLYNSDFKWTIMQPRELSAWKCYLFGCDQSIVLQPDLGKEPNWFWRTMQYLLLGNRWVKTS